jgi:calmodulin
MGQKPTEEELFQMISEVDDNMSGSIGKIVYSPLPVLNQYSVDFGEFLKVIENQKERAENFDDESDMSTFCAFLCCLHRSQSL